MSHRAAYTLLELVVSMTAAAVLMGGLAACLHVSTQVYEAQFSTVDTAIAAEVQAQIMHDVGRATSFTTRTADTVTFTVPDETGDSVEETLSYALDPNSGALNFTFNGTTTQLLSNVTTSQFTFLPRTITGSAATPSPFDVNDWGTRWGDATSSGVVFEEFTEQKESSNVTIITINVPPGTSENDLLIMAVAYDGEESFVNPVGWTRIHAADDNDGKVAFGVWWKLADAVELPAYSVTWSDDEKAYGWMMRFTGHDASSPIEATANAKGESNSPSSPAVSTSVDNCMILRLGGFDRNRITTDDAGYCWPHYHHHG